MAEYSISYDSSEKDLNSFGLSAIDWNWYWPNEWCMSWQDGPGNSWQPTRGLDQESYPALLEHFGLSDRQDEFPISRVINMSPKSLREAKDKLGREIHLYECEHRNDLGQRELDLRVSLSPPSAMQLAFGDRYSYSKSGTITLTPSEVQRLRIDMQAKGLVDPLFAKFGRAQPKTGPDLPERTYCWIEADVEQLILKSENLTETPAS